MLEFLTRFCVGGLLIASVPILASRYGGQYAGLILLFPIVTLTGFTFLIIKDGSSILEATAEGSLKAVPAVIAFLGTVYLVARLGRSSVEALLGGLAAWLIAAGLLIAFRWVR